MSLIRLDRVSKTYRMGEATIHALDQVSMEVEEGEFVAIMGPSGSGKSTLMNILGCLDTADEGVYALNGTAIHALKDDRLADIRNRTIGFVFQSFNLLPKLSAAENVELPLIYRGIARKERRRIVQTALQSVELQQRGGHKPAELSGGQQQRVAIARALAGNPPVILADEPTGALDSATGHDILRLLQALNAQGKTILLITHDPAIAGYAQRVIRISDGRIVS